jgi:hypothetical protein
MDEEFDLDINNYTIPDLLSIMDQDEPTIESVKQFTDNKIKQYENNPELIEFFKEMKDKLIQHLDQQFTTKSSSDKDKISVKVFNTEIKKGEMNPDITNTIQRVINIDSFYRETIEVDNQNTDNYTVRLTEPVNNVLSLTLMSVEIPYSWYTFTSAKGTTGIVISTLNGSNEIVTYQENIPDGNYTNFSLMAEVELLLNTKLSSILNADDQTYTVWWSFEQDPITGLLNIIPQSNISGGVTTYFPYDIKLLWFDVSYDTEVLINASINSNLGWLLGFRYESTMLYKSSTDDAPITIIAPSLINTTGTKYIIMKLNDYKSNRINNGLITNNNNKNDQISLPRYLTSNIQQSKFTYNKGVVKAFANAPRQLTSKQLYTINAISEHNISTITRIRIAPFNDSDIFAKIPVKQGSLWSSYSSGTNTIVNNGPGNLFIEYSGPLQKNIRDYFGPVDISTFGVSLYDDKGQLLGLNGMDWSFTLNAKCLYSY